MAILPKQWAESMKADSEQWRVRCLTCGNSRSLWELGGIRWKATAGSKRTMLRCSNCSELRQATMERV